ncbi:Protein CBG20762 [Caenorhabditis briggsae]|uniref:Protein CBG20762 n=1 Tax=Caenorhabditis briggsae TaxID=6238 RepID=A8XYJ9_CAEBR|nr:Protein CBG20762 [Caenorhabditis briggsae]CAP37716.2 Protein CBG20762 [Caenorhabditis briggsae]
MTSTQVVSDSLTETPKSSRNPPLPSEEIHLPGPHPARGIYGFALYIVSWSLLVVYLIWAITPVPILNRLGITYIPSKLWALAIGAFFPSAACLYVTIIFLINCWNFRGYKGGKMLKSFNPNYLRVLTRTYSTTRQEIQKTLNDVKKFKINRSAQVGEIHKRWAELEREQMNSIAENKEAGRYSTESMLGEKMLSQEPMYQKILEKRSPKIEKSIESEKSVTFPLQSIRMDQSSTSSDSYGFNQSAKQSTSSDEDRGFYVEADVFVDEYVAGSSLDLDPGDRMVATREYYGSDDAVERISFQNPGQRMAGVEENEQKGFSDNLDEHEPSTLTGTIIEDMPASAKKCSGCGANFHCKDSSLPGFVPLEILEKIDRKSSYHQKTEAQSLCKRCHLLQEHNFLLNVNVCDVDYGRMMSELKKQPESLVVLVVDVTDLPGSIYPKLAQIVGARRPMIVVGNKVDLLPPDAKTGYMWRFKKTVERAVEKAGLLEHFNILHTALVSAKTGYGIEELITEIYLKYTNVKLGMRGDIFLVGCTNAGKSTMFNALLQSDLCKVRAVDLVDRATTSIWPGTTISLLKFPVMKPGPYRLEMRRRRLLTHRAWTKKEMYARKLLLAETGDDRYAIPTSVIQNTYKDSEEELQPMALRELQGEEDDPEADRKSEENRKYSLDDPIFAKGKWCYDTPGTVNENQVLSLFTLDELVNVTPRRVLKPRTCLVKAGESLLIGGVGRIDIESIAGYSNVLLTTFTNDQLPLNVMPTHEVEEFYRKWLGTAALVVPQGDVTRMASWPGLESGRRFDMKGRRDEGCCDIVLSSIGWVMVTSEKDVALNAFAPANKGITARVQPILPYSASLRGKRLPGSQFYKVQPIEFPVNVRRKRAEARKRAEKKKERDELHNL